MTRLLKLVERVEEDLDIFLNDKGMTNQQAYEEIGKKLYEVDGLTWRGGFVVKVAEQLTLETIEEENIWKRYTEQSKDRTNIKEKAILNLTTIKV